MAPDDEILEAATRDGTMDHSAWPGLLDRLLPRLDHIVHNNFPIPKIPIQECFAHPGLSVANPGESPQSPTTDIGKPGPTSQSSPSRVAGTSPYTSQAIIPDSQASNITAAEGSLPPQILSFYSAIKSNLINSFSSAPPFTVQRLAELILGPSAHYRTLPSYLRALDRTISVSSTLGNFPLPSLSTTDNDGSNYLASSGSISLADDFNGAALTRIPWLRDTASMMISSDRPLTSDLRTESTSVIDGPNGAGSIETVTVSVNGFSSASRGDATQRPENSAPAERAPEPDMAEEDISMGANVTHRQDEEADEERVHARGPEEVGVEDMGPQQIEHAGHVFDAEAALGRPGEAEKVNHSENGEVAGERDSDGDTFVKDTTASENTSE